MDYRLVTDDDTVRIELMGEMTYESLHPAADDLVKALKGKPGPFVVDLSQVSYISEDGMALIVLIYRDAVCRGAQVYLEGAQGTVKDRIRRSGLDQFLKPRVE
jgi:anti-anti-sigma factor